MNYGFWSKFLIYISSAGAISLGITLVLQIIQIIKHGSKPDKFSHYTLILSSGLLFLNIIIRSILIQFPALTNTYESLLFFSAVTMLVLFIYRIKAGEKTFGFLLFGGTLAAFLLLALSSSPIAPSNITPPVPALQSIWLILHVVFSFVGESFFVIGFISSILYLATKEKEKKKRLDIITYRAITIGYLLFTIGALVFGAVWAYYSWGRYWGWDNKEIWALITWLTYTVYLHFRLIKKKQGNITAILSIIGFLFTMFTFLGVNLLLPGFHRYG